MLSTVPDVVDATPAAVSPDAGTPAGTVVLRAADLRFPGGGTVTAGSSAPSAGELAVFCRPVVTVPARVRRDGRILADGWLPDFVRLGELERHLGDGVIEAIVDAALARGRLKRRLRRRLMSYPLVIRLMIAMGLMPDARYGEALARLAGLLADVPFTLEWHVPAGKVITGWRLLIPAAVLEDIFWHAAGPLVSDDEASAVMLAGMMVCAADGMLVNLADTPENRTAFGSTGTADDSAPFPQLRIVALTARAGRAMLGAILGSCGHGEQTLLGRLAKRRPDLFAGRVTCFDRNFPGHELITAILDARGHVVARVGQPAAARALRRKDRAPVTADEESFTAVRHHMIRSMTSTQVTATSSLDALAAAADAAARAALHTLNIPGRQRHSERAQKARPKFVHTSATKTTVTGKPQVNVYAPGFS